MKAVAPGAGGTSCRRSAWGGSLQLHSTFLRFVLHGKKAALELHAAPPAACRPACRGSASGEFILPAVPDAARTAVVDRRQLTGKMKSTALEKNTTGSASPRRTIVLSLTTASSVILVLKETEAAKADALVGRFWALGQIRAWTWLRRVLDLDAPLT